MNGQGFLMGCALLAALSVGVMALDARHASRAAESAAIAATPMAQWTFEGCWTRSQGGTCFDIYHDAAGNHWICKACGTTKSPGPGKCEPISSAELGRGRWCS